MIATLRLLLVATLLALPLWVAHSAPAQACVCTVEQGDRDPFATLASRTDVIAVGKIGEMLVLSPESVENPETLGSRTPLEIKFQVSEYLKGSGPTALLIYQPAYDIVYEEGRITTFLGTDCDLFARLGDSYILFLSKSDSLRYRTGACSGNLRITEGQDVSGYIADIRAALERGPVLPTTGSGPPRHGPPLVPLAAASALAGVALAANAAFFLRRR